jgi:DNA-binding MarR family transcriptional regulator
MRRTREGTDRSGAAYFLMMCARAPFDPDLSHPALRTLAALSTYRNNKTGLAYPSTGLLARKLGVTQRAIQKHLRELERLGYIVQVTHPHGGYRGRRAFRIDLEKASTGGMDRAAPRSP